MTSVEQNFDHQRKENSIQLHDKLANILERFEETRQAIKDNVKMLENISDATTSIDSSAATKNDTIDSTTSYPYSYSKLGRSMSGNKLGGVDGASSTNYGLRTISSVDSGVMLTLTSSSEAGTQSRSRSFGSWTGTTSPTFLCHAGEQENEAHSIANNRLEENQTDESESSEESHNEDIDAHPSSSRATENEAVFPPSANSNNSKRSQDHRHSRVHEENSSLCTCNRENPTVTFYEDSEEDFEVQEQTISFEDDAYHVLSPPETDNHNHSATYTKHTSATPGQTRTCIVLPAIQKQRSRRRPNSLSVVFQPSKHDEWMEKDHFSVEENNSRQTDGDANRLERTWSSDSRLMFSPIPEESPTELTPHSDNKRKGIHRQCAVQQQTSKGIQRPTLLTVAQVNHHNSPPSAQRNSQAMIKSSDKEDVVGKKSKKFRHKRKKAISHQQPSTSHTHCVLSSSTSSGSSVQDGVPRSDAISLSSYRNAIDQHAITLPQIPEPKLAHRSIDCISSASSTSSYDFTYSSSSSSGCSDSEYEFEVSRQTNPHRVRMPKRNGQMLKNKNQTGGSKEATAPVLRKLGKEKLTIKTSESPITQSFQKPRLFKKNSTSSPKLHSKLMKTKSDEASYSLLRYFSFPSPPRTAVDESSDNPGNNRLSTSHHDRTPGKREGEKSFEESGRRAHRSRQKENIKEASVCSCATSTTTDTASEIAYPDLCRPKNNSTRVVIEDITAKSRNLPTRSTQMTHTKASQTGHTDIKSSTSSLPTVSAQIPSSIAASSPSVMSAPLPTFVRDSGKNYTLHVHPPTEKVKKKRRTFFDKLFRKQKATKSQTSSQEIPLDSKLTLDLTGGEVRVRSTTAESIPYVMVAHPNPSYPPPHPQPVPPYPIYRPYLESPDVRNVRQAPIYVVPADESRLPGRDDYLLPHHRHVDMPAPPTLHYPYVYADERHRRRVHSNDNSYYRTRSSNNHFVRSQSNEHLSRLREGQHRDYLHVVDNYEKPWRRNDDRGVVRYYNHPNNQTFSKMQGASLKQPPYQVVTQRRKYYQIL